MLLDPTAALSPSPLPLFVSKKEKEKRKLPHPLTPRTLALQIHLTRSLSHITAATMPIQIRHHRPRPRTTTRSSSPPGGRPPLFLRPSRRPQSAPSAAWPPRSSHPRRRTSTAISAGSLPTPLRLPRPACYSGTSTRRTWWSPSWTACSSRGPRRRPSWTWSPPPTASGRPGPIPRRPRHLVLRLRVSPGSSASCLVIWWLGLFLC